MFFGLFGGSTPRYQGAGAPPARQSTGLLGLLSGLFGGTGAPAYAGDGQPAASGGIGFRLFAGSPVYKQPPVEPASPETEVAENEAQPEATNKAVTIIVLPGSTAVDEGFLQRLQDRVLDD